MFDPLYSIFGSIWLFYMLAFPSKYGSYKIALLVLINIFSFLELVNRRKKINLNLILYLLIFLILFIFFGLNSEFNDYEISNGIVNVFYFLPIVAINISQIFYNKKRINFLLHLLATIALFISIYDILNILSNMKILPSWFTFESEISGAFRLNDEVIEARITNETSLIFLFPFFISYKLGISEKRAENDWLSFLVNSILLLSLPIVFFSGRRALQLAVLISSLLFFIIKLITASPVRIIIPIIKFIKIALIGIIIITLITASIKAISPISNPLGSFAITLFRVFDADSSSGQYRYEQAMHLFENWPKSTFSIFCGNGLAAYSEKFIANNNTKYSYEMVYFALLFQTGLVGTCFFFLGVFFICMRNIKCIVKYPEESPFFISLLTAFICCILGGGTNPFIYYPWIWAFALIPYCYRNEAHI